MKKIVCLAFVIMLMACFCGNASAIDYSFLDDMSLEELQALNAAVTAKINEVKPKPSVNKSDLGMWVLGNYVDEFNEPTGKKFITNKNKMNGTFSNSATKDSELEIDLIINKQYVYFQLYEYGWSKVRNFSQSNESYQIMMKDASGEKHTLTGLIPSDDERLYCVGENAETIVNALKQEGKIVFSISDTKYGWTRYVFTIDNTSGFCNAYDLLMGQ